MIQPNRDYVMDFNFLNEGCLKLDINLFDLDSLRDDDLDCLDLVSLLSLLLFGVSDLFRMTLDLPRDLLLDLLLDLLIDLLRDLLLDRVFVLSPYYY